MEDFYRRVWDAEGNKKMAEAVAHREALRFYRPEAHPDRCRSTARNPGKLCFKDDQLAQARAAYATAIRAAEVPHRASYSPRSKEAELAENAELYKQMVQVCLGGENHAAAQVHVEGGKGRAFLDQMGQGAFPLPPGLPGELLGREAELIGQLREQEQALAPLLGSGTEAGGAEKLSRWREVIERRRETLAAVEAMV